METLLKKQTQTFTKILIWFINIYNAIKKFQSSHYVFFKVFAMVLTPGVRVPHGTLASTLASSASPYNNLWFRLGWCCLWERFSIF